AEIPHTAFQVGTVAEVLHDSSHSKAFANDEMTRRIVSTAHWVHRPLKSNTYRMSAGGTPATVDLCRCGRRLRRSRNHREHQRFPARRASVLSEPKRGNAPS